MRTYEYRLRPNKAQEQALMTSRKMYNTCLEELITHYKETGKYLHLYEQDKRHGRSECIKRLRKIDFHGYTGSCTG
ncbi:MAG: hypothetical protein E6I90_13020 [Chloroflexi bacterium]|nr:MAG: hypothetical protein E6I90_13020 [Chloroflexota bacterium]